MKTTLRTTLFMALLVGLTTEAKAQWVTTGAANSMSVSNPLGNRHLFLENTDSTGAPLKFYLSGNTISAGLQIGRDDSGHDIFLLGDVGIGSISAPSYKLDVNGTIGASDKLSITTSTTRLIDLDYTGSGGFVWQSFRDNGTEKWWFRSDVGDTEFTLGEVGVGDAWSVLSNSFEVYKNTNITGSLKTTAAYTLEAANPTMILKETGVTDNNWDIQVNNGDFKILKVNDARSAFEEVFHISDNSNVGIGTASPASSLHITSASDPTVSIGTLNGNTGNSKLQFYSGINGSNNGYAIKYTRDASSDRLGFVDGGGFERLSMLNGGNVGIGTTDPTSKLHIDGNVKIEDGGRIHFDRPSGASVGAIGWHTDDIFYIGGHPSNGPTAGNITRLYGFGYDLRLGNSANGDVLTVDGANGNVGIGTVDPNSKLTVAGTIKSQEVIVEATAGADFVFEEDYDLPTLAEIEKFIKANKHLEGIPSAKEMVENGVKIGELQIKLLQKIEELTLHTIQLKKENTELKKQESINNAQQALIKELLTRIEKLEKERN